jgi:hypothetical protein
MGVKTGNPRGRPKGSANKATAAKAAEIAASGLTPLDFMLSILRDKGSELAARFEAAKAAAPYVHPRLAAVEHSGDMTLHHEDALDELE